MYEYEVSVKLSDGRKVDLEHLVGDYERFLECERMWESEREALKEEITELKQNKPIKLQSNVAVASKLKVGKWFLIDRKIIDENQEEIKQKCYEAETANRAGIKLWERFEKSNKIANENPKKYPLVFETCILEYNWEGNKSPKELIEMCQKIGDGICDFVMCDFELQMRICNGEPVDDLVGKADKLPYPRFVKCHNDIIAYLGGGANVGDCSSPSYIFCEYGGNILGLHGCTPYAYRIPKQNNT